MPQITLEIHELIKKYTDKRKSQRKAKCEANKTLHFKNKGQMRFALLMNYLGGYKVQIPCRYSNNYAL